MEWETHGGFEMIDPFGNRFFRHLSIKPLVQLRQKGQFHFRFPRFPGALGGPESNHPFTAFFVFKSASAGTGIVAPDHEIHTSQENSSTFQYTTNPRGNKAPTCAGCQIFSRKKRKRKKSECFHSINPSGYRRSRFFVPTGWPHSGSRRRDRSHFPSRRHRCLQPPPRRIPECRFSFP